MSQSDLNVANGSGAVVRADINVHLDVLATNSSGPAAPTPTFPNQWWMDESTNLLKQRNVANTSWITVALKNASGWSPYFQGTQTQGWSTKTNAVTESAVPVTTVASTDDGSTYEIDTTAGPRTLALPPVVGTNGFYLRAKNVGASGNALIVDPDGVETINDAPTLLLGDNEFALIYSTGAEWRAMVVQGSVLPPSHLSGLGTSNGTDSDHEIDVAPGAARDDGDKADIRSFSPITIDIENSGAGGLDTGSVAANTNYFSFIIRDSSNGQVSAILSASKSSPTLPGTYDQKRYLASHRTDGAANLKPYRQNGDEFYWVDPDANGLDVSATGQDLTEQTQTLPHAPPDTVATLNAGLLGTEGAYCWLYETDRTTGNVGNNASVIGNLSTQGNAVLASVYTAQQVRVRVDSAQQIRSRVGLTAGPALYIQVMGWTDRRGRDD